MFYMQTAEAEGCIEGGREEGHKVWHAGELRIFKEREANEWNLRWIPQRVACHMQTKLKCTTTAAEAEKVRTNA